MLNGQLILRRLARATMMQVENQNMLRAAIALNNYGVALLEKGQVRASLETLQDAIVGAKASSSGESPLVFDIQSRIRLAESRLMSLVPPSTTSTQSVEVVSDDYVCSCDDTSSMLVEGGDDQLQSVRAIRIESATYGSLVDQDPELIFVSIMYNYGVSNACCSQHASRESKTRLLQGSIRILSLTSAMLCSWISKHEGYANERLLMSSHLSSAVFAMLYKLLDLSGRHVEAKEYFVRWSQVRETVKAANFKTVFPSYKSNAPAA